MQLLVFRSFLGVLSLYILLVLSASASLVSSEAPRPLVLWHGLGDSYSSPGMLQFASSIKEMHSGLFIHSIYLDQDLDRDRKAGFYGNVNEQIAFAAEQLAAIPELRDGFDAIGLSQGGQFLRAYVEQYNIPPVNNLITFGSQHMGISDIPACRPYDFICQVARRATKSAVYGEWAQTNLVQAQYFRDPTNIETYLEANQFLTSINNERRDSHNETFGQNLASLNALVLVLFTEDKTVVPKESAWFGSEAVPKADLKRLQYSEKSYQHLFASEKQEKEIVPMRLQPLYIEDWIGLRELDVRGGIIFETCEGEHMQMGDCWKDLVRRFVGGPQLSGNVGLYNV